VSGAFLLGAEQPKSALTGAALRKDRSNMPALATEMRSQERAQPDVRDSSDPRSGSHAVRFASSPREAVAFSALTMVDQVRAFVRSMFDWLTK